MLLTFSPSKLTYRIGEQFGDGLALGITSKTATVAKASKDLALAAVSPVSAGVPSAGPLRVPGGTSTATVDQSVSIEVHAEGQPDPTKIGIEIARQQRAAQFARSRQ